MSDKKELVVYSLIGVLSAGAGFGGGYILAAKRHKRIADEEIASVKDTYSRLRANANKPTPEDLAEQARNELATREALELIAKYDGTDEPKEPESKDEFLADVEEEVEEKVVETVRDIFEEHSDAAAMKPKVDAPFVVSLEQWEDNEWDNHAKVTLTYYKGDDTLADDQERVVDDVERMVGAENLTRFGQGSGDPQLVYIRNEKLGLDFEVYLNEGRYLPNNEE